MMNKINSGYSKTMLRILKDYADLEFDIQTIEMKLNSVKNRGFVKRITKILNSFRFDFDCQRSLLPNDFEGDVTNINKVIKYYAEKIRKVDNEVDEMLAVIS